MAVAVSLLAREGAEALLGGHCPLITENILVGWAGQIGLWVGGQAAKS